QSERRPARPWRQRNDSAEEAEAEGFDRFLRDLDGNQAGRGIPAPAVKLDDANGFSRACRKEVAEGVPGEEQAREVEEAGRLRVRKGAQQGLPAADARDGVR